jgi:hypothetical protein
MHRARPLIPAIVLAVLWLLAAPARAAPPTGALHRAGDAAVVAAGDHGATLDHGGSTTTFTIALPSGADCPGDSEHEQWRVQSFLVPIGDDPGTLRYGIVGPQGTNQYALYDVDTHPFVDVLTPPNAVSGRHGAIPAIPAIDFAVFPPGLLPPGRYRVGIACTLFRVTATYWDTEIVIAADVADHPAQLTWRSAAATTGSGNSTGAGSRLTSIPVLLVAVLAAAGATAGTIAVRRRSRRSLITAKGSI